MRTYILVLGLLFFIAPSFVHAVTLVNINTADAVLLDTLPGIGPAYATRIVDYRTQHGPFARIEDIQNVSGIGPSTYANLKDFITVGEVGTTNTPAVSDSTVPPEQTSGGSATPYVPPPSSISMKVSGNQNALREVPITFSAQVTTKSGAIDPSARIVWSFGDGSSGEGSAVEKTYRYEGTYLVVVTATDGAAMTKGDLLVTVKSAQVRISSVLGEGITLANDSNERLDLSGWRFLAEGSSFRIPVGTELLPHTSVLLPYAIINLPVSLEVTLQYPNGIIAAQYAPNSTPAVATTLAITKVEELADVVEKPSVASASYKQVQKRSISSSKISAPLYENTAVSAPAATTELAAAGAALLAPTPAPIRSSGLLHSPWVLGLLGVVALAGGVFILL